MKSNKSIDKQFDEDIKCSELSYNHQETLKLENSTLYTRYKKWLKDNGVLVDPRLRYPSYFGQSRKGIVGVSANKAIQKNRAVIAVPYNLLITVDKVKEDLQLFQILKDNLSYFKGDDDAALKLLILYVSTELIKGEKSFYYPYFSISTEEYLSGWQSKSLLMLQQRNVISSLREQKQQMQLEFMNFLRIYRRYENVFPQKLTNTQYKAIFQKSYIFIITRAFGWSLPSISLIPLADSLNHSNIRYVNHFLVNIDEERRPVAQQGDKNGGYKKFCKLVNLSILKDENFNLNQNQLAQLRKQHKSKPLKFIEKHKELLSQSEKLQGMQSEKPLNIRNKAQIRNKQYHVLYQQYKAGVHKFKNLHFYQSSCDEDNDTDEDELFEREMQHEKFLLNDKQRVVGENAKKKEVTRLWKLYIDNQSDEEQEEEEVQKQNRPKNKEGNKKLKEEIQQKMLKQNNSSSVSSEGTQQDDQQIWDWTDKADHRKTYFIMSTKEIIRQNQQIYNFYGRRSNKFLLGGYNFVMQDNIYDSYWLNIKLDPKLTTKVAVSKLLQFGQKKQNSLKSRPIKLKRYIINQDLINICRSYIILWIKKEWNNCKLTIPFDRQIEIKTFQLYSEIIKYIQRQFTTSLEEDQQLQEAENLKYEQRTSIILRKQYKKILKGQQVLASKCLQWINRWDLKGCQKFQQSQMKWIRRIKSYLISLQQATSL